MGKQWSVLWMAVFVSMLIGSARADEISDLRKEQEALYNQIMEMNNRLIKLEIAQREQAKDYENGRRRA